MQTGAILWCQSGGFKIARNAWHAKLQTRSPQARTAVETRLGSWTIADPCLTPRIASWHKPSAFKAAYGTPVRARIDGNHRGDCSRARMRQCYGACQHFSRRCRARVLCLPASRPQNSQRKLVNFWAKNKFRPLRKQSNYDFGFCRGICLFALAAGQATLRFTLNS